LEHCVKLFLKSKSSNVSQSVQRSSVSKTFSPLLMRLEASIKDQTLSLYENSETPSRVFPISSAKNGTGSQEGSFRTPLGRFRIAHKYGKKAPLGTIFRSRKPVGIWPTQIPSNLSKDDDLVLSRILWLEGIDPHNLNTKQRYIYLHGTNHEDQIGTPCSAGCLRLNNSDIIELFDLIAVGTALTIL